MGQRIGVVILWVGAVCLLSMGKVAGETQKSPQSPQKESSGEVVAFYFHGNFRCDNCRRIEQYSREAIDKYFSEQLKTQRLTFKVINIDLPENEHFINDYQLYTRSLVIAEFKNGKQVRWKNLTKVWDYLDEADKFYDYVRSEIRAYLESS